MDREIFQAFLHQLFSGCIKVHAQMQAHVHVYERMRVRVRIHGDHHPPSLQLQHSM